MAGGGELFGSAPAWRGYTSPTRSSSIRGTLLGFGSRPPTIQVQPQVFEGPRLDNLTMDFGELYGTPIPVTYGVRLLYGRPIWWDDLIEDTITSTENREVSGGPDVDDTHITYRYRASVALSLGVMGLDTGVTPEVRKIWFNGEKVYDRSSRLVFILPGLVFRFYPGTPTQPADPAIIADQGVANTPAFRHLAIIVFEKLDLTRWGNRFPDVAVEILDHAATTPPGVDTITYLTSSREGTRGGFDWDGGVWYGIGADALMIFSLATNAEIASIPVTYSTNIGHVESEEFMYVPWMHMLIGVGGSAAFANPRFYAMDPLSGVIMAQSDLIAVGTATGFVNSGGLVAQKVVTANGGRIETWVVGIANAPDKLVVATYDPTDGFTIKHNAGGFGSEMRGLTAGPIGVDESVVYFGGDATVYEAKLSDDGVSASAVYTSVSDIQFLHYDPADKGLVICHTTGTWRKVSTIDWSTVLWTSGASAANAPRRSTFGERIVNRIGFGNPALFATIDLKTGEKKSYSPGGPNNSNDWAWDDLSGSLFILSRVNPNPGLRVHTGYLTAGRTSLRAILEAIWAEPDTYEVSDYDFSAVTDMVDGLVRNEDTTLNAITADTAKAFGYFAVETDKVYLRKTPTDGAFSVSATLAEDELIDQTDGPRFQALAIPRQDPIRVPQRVEFNYLEATLDYKWSVQPVRRMLHPIKTTPGRDMDRLRVPVVITATEAQKLAYKHLYRLWQARTKLDFATGLGRIDIEPGDAVTVTRNGISYTVRIVEETFSPASWTLSRGAELVLEREEVETTGDGGSKLREDIVVNNNSLFLPLDLPLLRPSHDLDGTGLVFYFTLGPRGQDNWDGAIAYTSGNNGITWGAIGSQVVANPIGVATTVLAAPADPYRTDTVSTFIMRLRSGDEARLVDVTQLQMLNGANEFAIGRRGRWEIVRVRDWTANGDGTYTAANLLRGLRGTEVFCGSHAVGDLVVMLEQAQMAAFPMSALDQSRLFKAVGIGVDFFSVAQVSGTITGTAETPYAPAQLTATISGSDIILEWEDRTRLNGEWKDLTETMPLDEDSLEWEVEIMDGASIKRTYTGITASTKTYPDADIIADWGSMPVTLTWRVYKISQDLKAVNGSGRGYRATKTSTLV